MIRLTQTLPAALAGGLLIALGGCAHNDTDNQVVPASAMQMSTGDRQIAVTAPHDGVVYVRDDTDNRVLYSADVHKGQVVRYDPGSESITIDDHLVAGSVHGMNHPHSIFFQRSSSDETANGSTTGPSDVPVIHVPLGVKVDVQTQPSSGQ